MQQAAQQMQQGRSASAASSQREAQEALEEARAAVEDGTQPSDPEGQQKAADLAQDQAAVERELLELARLNEERKNSRPNPSLQQAAQSAQAASSSLEDGDLSEAQEQEQDVQDQIAQAMEPARRRRRAVQAPTARRALVPDCRGSHGHDPDAWRGHDSDA